MKKKKEIEKYRPFLFHGEERRAEWEDQLLMHSVI